MKISRHLWPLIIAAVSVISALFPLKAEAQGATERNRRFIAQAFEQWSNGSSSFFQDVLAPDVIWTIKGTSPAAGTYRNRQDFLDRAVKPFADRMSSPVRPTVKNIWADGDHVVVYWDGAGKAADGQPYRNSYVWIFRMVGQRAAEVIAFLDLVPYDAVISRVRAAARVDTEGSTGVNPVGMWVTADGRIRHDLRANGRYDEARGTRESAYRGRYEVTGNRINYWDDTGFTADGSFVSSDELHHGGMVFYRRK
jgi:ketosteroid isomerase-like protein